MATSPAEGAPQKQQVLYFIIDLGFWQGRIVVLRLRRSERLGDIRVTTTGGWIAKADMEKAWPGHVRWTDGQSCIC